MAKKKRTPSTPQPATARDEEPKSVTVDRAARLCKLLRLLGKSSQSRPALLQRLKIDIRKFYRDLEALRKVGVVVMLQQGRYTLQGDVDEEMEKLPLPDPQLTLGEAAQLAKGRTAAHRKIKARINAILT